MILKCVENKISHIDANDEIKDKLYAEHNLHAEHNDNIVGSLVVGSYHVVYTIGLRSSGLSRFYIDNQGLGYPISYMKYFFEVYCNKLSRYWRLFSAPEGDFHSRFQYDFLMTFPEWGKDEHFYGRLIDGGTQEVALYAKYKRLMDLEFLHPGIGQSTIPLGIENWVMCPHCDETWEENKYNGISRCPKCSLHLRNSIYQEIA